MIRPNDVAAMHARRLRDVDIIHRNTNEVVAAEWRMASTSLLYAGTVATFFLFYVTVRDGVDPASAALALAGLWAVIALGAYANRRHLAKWAGRMRDIANERQDAEQERHLSSLEGGAK